MSRDPEILEMLELRFELEGFTVMIANGNASKKLASKNPPALLVADLMTHHKEELTACHELLLAAAKVKRLKRILILPRGTLRRDHNKAWPADKVLAKPFELEMLVATAIQLLEKKEG